MSFHITADGKFPANATGKPTLITETDFAVCCCGALDCDMDVWVKVCCMQGVFALANGVHKLSRQDLYDDEYFANAVLTTDNVCELCLYKHATYGWQVTIRVLKYDGTTCTCTSDGTVGSVKRMGRSPASTADCPPIDVLYDSAKYCGSCTSGCDTFSPNSCTQSATYGAVYVSDTQIKAGAYYCECCAPPSHSETDDTIIAGHGWDSVSATGDVENADGVLSASFIYDDSAGGETQGPCGNEENPDTQTGTCTWTVCLNRPAQVTYEVWGNVETENIGFDYAAVLRGDDVKISMESVTEDGECVMESMTPTPATETLTAGTYTFKFDVDTRDGRYHDSMVHNFKITFEEDI
jgi:hypothetical protein